MDSEELLQSICQPDELFGQLYDERQDWQRDYDHSISCMFCDEVDGDVEE